MSDGPRVRTISRSKNSGLYKYRGCEISVERDHSGDDWYIRVQYFNGGYLYDGYWTDSQFMPQRAAVIEATIGSQLWKPKQPSDSAGDKHD